MLTATQDIDYFIERQRSKLNKGYNRQPANRQQGNRQRQPPPAPPPPPQSLNPANLDGRLDVRVNRILDEASPRAPSEQRYFPPSPRPVDSRIPFPEQQQQFSYDFEQEQYSARNNNEPANTHGFFDRFGNHDATRSRLKDDLKREYNEFLQSQKTGAKSRASSKNSFTHGNTTRRVQFAQNATVVAPWEKGNTKAGKDTSNATDTFSSPPPNSTSEYMTNRSRSRLSQSQDQYVRDFDEQYIRAREEYILELHEQIRELEARKKQLEYESSKLSSSNSSSVTRAHYAEDLNALNTLLAERLNQRNAIDHELARILNRPPVATTAPLAITNGVPPFNVALDLTHEPSSQRNPPSISDRNYQSNRNDNRSRGNIGKNFRIGQDVDKDAEQANKKRYQQELQAQIRESQMRKAQAKQEKAEYERRLETENNRYNYFGRSGGGAPMRDRDGNVIANLSELRNPQQQSYLSPRSQQLFGGADDKVYSLGGGASSITNAPFYNGEPKPNALNTGRPGSPNYARNSVITGIFGNYKTDEQLMREEKYKEDLKKQIDEKRQRNAEELARRRAEEERELAKHVEWQQQMEKQMAEETARKQEREAQERSHQQRVQEDLERQRRQEEMASKRKAKRPEKPTTPNNDEDDVTRQNTYDEQHDEGTAYRSSSPPVPTIKNKDRKRKSNMKDAQRQPVDDSNQEVFPPIADNDEHNVPAVTDERADQYQHTHRKPPTPKRTDVPPAQKKPARTNRSRHQPNFETSGPYRTNSNSSLRSDGSDSEVLNRLEHLKRQLKDKEARLYQQAKSRAASLTNINDQVPASYIPPSYQPPLQRQTPDYLLNSTRFPRRHGLSDHDDLLRVIRTDDDDEFKPSYFRDDSILMRSGGAGGGLGGEYISPSTRVDLVDGMFVTDTDNAIRRRRHGLEPPGYYDPSNPTSMANLELNRIAENNEHRLKKLRDLEKDDTSLLDSNEVLERFQQKQRLQRRGSQTTLQDDAWLK